MKQAIKLYGRPIKLCISRYADGFLRTQYENPMKKCPALVNEELLPIREATLALISSVQKTVWIWISKLYFTLHNLQEYRFKKVTFSDFLENFQKRNFTMYKRMSKMVYNSS